MRIIILGAPGSGKDTEARLIAKKYKLKLVSIGDYFRDEYKKRTKLGIKSYQYWSKGKLCPDNIVINIIKKNLPNNYILGGFPRTLKQANFLQKFSKPDYVLYLKVSKNILVNRLINRAIIEGRLDDTKDIINKRIIIYKKRTEPLINFYEKKSVLFQINGNRNVKIILKDIIKILDKLKK